MSVWCGRASIDYETLIHLEYVREHFSQLGKLTQSGLVVSVGGGFRCAEYNAEIGGAKNSFHKDGAAADIHIPGVSVAEMYHYFNSRWPDRYGIGVYVERGFLHFDSRLVAARWTKDKVPTVELWP